ncbi:MAG: hypothetical protein N2Z73_03780 [Endomicrobia bacterium]|nr:hypothetical protein [Endomicrobiia bacterium]
MKLEFLINAIIYKLHTYKKALLIVINHLFKRTFYKRDKDYYSYIGESKQLYCKHTKISKLSSTKFYCSECGKILHLIPEELSLIGELFGMLLVGSIVYLLTKKKK